MRTISDEVLAVLQHASCDENTVILNCGQLDRKLYTQVNKVLETLGGKWNRKAKGHVFEENPSEVLADAISTGQYIDRKQVFQYFPTPDALAGELCDRAGVGENMTVLEPSAGDGAIVRAAKARGAEVTAIELDTKHFAGLSKICDAVQNRDFLEVEPSPIFDAVVMNPPFTRSQDIAHVMHAFKFLKPGGKLVSVMATGWTFRQDKMAQIFREFLHGNGGRYEQLEPKAFRESGTDVNAVVVEIAR